MDGCLVAIFKNVIYSCDLTVSLGKLLQRIPVGP